MIVEFFQHVAAEIVKCTFVQVYKVCSVAYKQEEHHHQMELFISLLLLDELLTLMQMSFLILVIVWLLFVQVC